MADPYIAHTQACPACGETVDVEGDIPEIDGACAFQRITCNSCGCRYVEVYEYARTEAYELALCDRCGAPIAGDAYVEPISMLELCDVCYHDMHHV